MLFYVAILAALLSLATAALTDTISKRTSNCAIDSSPWIASNLTAFEAVSGSKSDSYISFHFCDTNPGLELDTECTRTVAAGSNVSIIDGSYHNCEDIDVRFIYQGDTLYLERMYEDDCLGDYPYNYAEAFGSASTDVTNITTCAGTTCTQEKLIVKITMSD